MNLISVGFFAGAASEVRRQDREVPTERAYARPRPLRVAYLVEECADWRTIFDEIVAEAYGRWGGRFTLVVPCEGGIVRPAYMPWLRHFDADIVYSYVDLADLVVAQLHELASPAFLVRHEVVGERKDYDAFRPKLPLSGLTVLSVCGWLARGDTMYAPRPVEIVDTYISTKPSSFLQENFGCYSESMISWPIAANMSSHIQATMHVPPAIQADKSIVPRPEGNIVSTEQELIDKLGTQRNLMGLAQLSATMAPRLELTHSRWSSTVNFVVGDSFADRVAFWNGRHHAPAWLHGGVATLRASIEDIEDEARFASIVQIIKNRVYHPVGGNSSHTQIMLRSASVSEKRLADIALKFKSADKFNLFAHEMVASVDAVVPAREVLERPYRYVDPTMSFQPADWHEFAVVDGSLRPPNIFPRHIRDLPSLPGVAKQGFWPLDLRIERAEDLSKYSNIKHTWRLSPRLRMTGAFLKGYQSSGISSPICMPRTSGDGFLTLFADQQSILPEFMVPSDSEAFRYALCALRDWWPFISSKADLPSGPAFDMRPSDKGRYLTALLRIADGIHGAAGIFLSEFWAKQFNTLGATPKATEERIARVTGTLQKRLSAGEIKTEDHWRRIASVVLAEARAERLPQRYLKFDRVANAFEEFRATKKARVVAQAESGEIDRLERQSLVNSLTYLCQREILHQGHEWRCQRCFANNWVSIDDLKRSMTCEVCASSQPAPVSEPWRFKLNGFVLEAIREHGALPMIWCLSRLAGDAKESFFYLAAHELFYTRKGVEAAKPDAEIDILAVADGRVSLCEVKSSNYALDIPKLAALAHRVRPDEVILAVMEPRSKALSDKLTQLRKSLVGTDISAHLMCLKSGDLDDWAILPAGSIYRTSGF
jgi:hypothetical protein